MSPMANRVRLSRPEVEILRRSVGASGQLPRDQLDRLLDETAILLEEREHLARLFEDLSPPWRDVRGTLNELHRLHRLLSQPSPPPR
jgi:hypothetical protein